MTSSRPTTITQLLSATVARSANRQALGTICGGQLTWRTWAEIHADVQRLAHTLLDADIQPGDRVVQTAENCYAWILVDLAVLSIGAVHVPLHGSSSAAQVVEQIKDCGARLIFLSSAWQQKLRGHLDPSWKIVVHGPTSPGVRAPGLRVDERALEAIPNSSTCAEPQTLATILYTSGTTGQPRGVMLSHENLTSNAIATTEAVGSQAEETRLCFLPLSHIYARTCDLYSWLYRGTRLVLAENRDTILRDCQLVQPTVLNGVPYFYQKVAQWLDQADPPRALRELLGGKIKRCFCGGAAVATEVESLFAAEGLPLLAGYGLTEASPVITATSPGNYRAGTVGQPLSGVEVRLSDSGEILARGPNIMLGYWRDEAATRSVLRDGWLHTGDLGKFDSAGHLRIVGRRKEILVLSTGKNVSPARVEQLLAGSRWIEHVCVVGDGRKCLAALIVPNPETLRAEIRRQRLWVWSRRRAVTHPRIRALFRREIDRLLAEASQEEQIGPFVLLDRGFSIERGELTAKLSLQRAKIAKNFAAQIEAMYAGIRGRGTGVRGSGG